MAETASSVQQVETIPAAAQAVRLNESNAMEVARWMQSVDFQIYLKADGSFSSVTFKKDGATLDVNSGYWIVLPLNAKFDGLVVLPNDLYSRTYRPRTV